MKPIFLSVISLAALANAGVVQKRQDAVSTRPLPTESPTLIFTHPLETSGTAYSLPTETPTLIYTNPIRPTPTVDPRYRCNVDADCTIVNHGNCCGYYPVCAHVGATFTAQEACPKPGMVGVCGFPVIDHCVCTKGVCEAVPVMIEDPPAPPAETA